MEAFSLYLFLVYVAAGVILGGGLKAIVGENAAVRVEYWYRRVRNSRVGNVVSESPRGYLGSRRGSGRKQDFDSHGVYFGVSIFVNRRAT